MEWTVQTEVSALSAFHNLKLYSQTFLKKWAGELKLARIRENSNFFRAELQKMGFKVLGVYDSPIMPIMLYNPAKIAAFSRECLRENVSLLFVFQYLTCFRAKEIHLYVSMNILNFEQLAIVVVSFPPIPLLLARARICNSASHLREDLIKALQVEFTRFLSIVAMI